MSFWLWVTCWCQGFLTVLFIKTTIGVSQIHGIGLFTAEFIQKGTITWQYHSDLDPAYSEEDILQMPNAARASFFKYAYYDKNLERYILCSDDQRFINHEANSPNIRSTPRQDVAARDIEAGEELVCDYNAFDDTYFTRLGLLQFSKNYQHKVLAD